ncbi:DUF1642 domain-containing protein [Lactococcus lactis]|uniref:DUF1642 domain-containing protein n=1 Tax=Lactococcus lactis TaxID=1358 RepID=UPI00319E4091
MTKFEEEFKALTSWDWINIDLIQRILTRFGNWHSDEEFQEMKESYWNQAESILSMLDEIKSLRSQLQQQSLPVVPDFIGKLINTFGAPEDGKYINYSASYLENQKELDWIDNHQKTWLTALLIGFRVEKPQLFYLRDELTGHYLYRRDKVSFGEQDYCKDRDDKPLDYCLFTQQEIDSIQTGSYEQIEVVE